MEENKNEAARENENQNGVQEGVEEVSDDGENAEDAQQVRKFFVCL